MSRGETGSMKMSVRQDCKRQPAVEGSGGRRAPGEADRWMDETLEYRGKEYSWAHALLPRTGERTKSSTENTRGYRMAGNERKNPVVPVIAGVAMNVAGRNLVEEEPERVLEELEKIVNRSPAVAFLWRATEGWPVEFVSENVRQFGYTPADFTSGRILYARIIHPQDLERVTAEVFRYSREGRDEFVHEYRILTASGEVRWLDDRTWIRRDQNGAVTHYQGVVLDVTERKRAEEALRESEERYRSLIELMPEAIAVHRDGTIIYVNPACVRIAGGKSPEDLVGRSIYQFVHPEFRDLVAERVIRQQQGGTISPPIEEKFLTLDGRTRWVEITGAPMFYQGQPANLAIFRDISDRKLAEERIRQAEHRSAVLLGAIPDLMFVLSREGEYRDFQVPDVRLLALPPDEIIGKNIRDVGFSPESLDVILQMVRRAIDTRELQRVEYELAVPSGIRQFEARLLALNDQEVLCIVRDITDQKRVEEALRRHTDDLIRLHRQLEASNREANLYLDILTHDIGNTENVANLYADLLIESLEGEEARYAEQLQRSIRKSIEILRTVSTIRRIHQASPELKPMDLDAVIRRAIEAFPGGTFRYEGTQYRVMADDLLSVVFNNLIGNVVRFGGPEVVVTVRVEEEDGSVVVTVADTGPGVPDDEKDAIFHRYEEQKRGVGEGLGLYLVQILAERYGGRVWVEDRIPGHPEEGAAFRFTLGVAG